MGSAHRYIVPVAHVDIRVGCTAESHRCLRYRPEHRLHIGRRTGDDLEDVGGGRLTLQRRLGGVACGADLRLGTPALGDVAVDQDEAAAGNCVAAYFDHCPIGPRALKPQLAIRVFEAAGELGFDVLRAKFAAFGQQAEVVGIGRAFGKLCLGQPDDLLKVAVPRGQA